MYADVDEEDLDDDFFQELDAAEAAATRSRFEGRDASSNVTDNSTSGDAPIKKSAANIVPSAARTPAQSARAPKTPAGDGRCQARRTSEPGTRMPKCAERCSQGCTMPAAGGSLFGSTEPTYEHHWEAKRISVRDGSAGAEEDVGKGSLTVRWRQESDGAVVLLNAVVMAAGGGSAMEIPREAITRLSDGQTKRSLPSNSPALESPAVLLELGIGCTLVLSGLIRRGEQRSTECNDAEKTPITDAGGAVGRDTADADVAAAAAAVVASELAKMGAGGGGAGGAMPPLTTATPERRQLAPTEFLTPSPAFANQGGGGGRVREEAASGGPGSEYGEILDGVGSVVPSPPVREALPCPGVGFDPVLAKLIRDNSSRSSSATATTTTTTTTTTTATQANDMPGTPSATTKGLGGQPALVGTAEHWGVGLASGRGALDDQPKRAANEDGEQAAFPPGRVVALASSDSRPVVKGEETGLVGDGSDGGSGGGGSGGRGGGGGGGGGGGRNNNSGKGDCKPVIALHGELDVPDGEWRRPLVASPENRRRAGAGRRRPNARDGSTKRCVVLSLDGPGGGDNGDGRAEKGGGGADKRSRRAGEEEGPSRRRSRKRPLGGSGESVTGWPEGGKANPAAPPPPPPPQRRAGGKVEGSWLTLRKALHERYRDFQENGAAEQAASEADRGSGSKGSGWGGEMLLPGLRVFRRQEQAFTYADALEARLAPDDAARYKVLSFETSSTGSRKFLVCDVRRFEEHYPYTAAPSQCIFPQAQARRPRPRPPPQPAAHPPRAEHGSDQTDPCHVPVLNSAGAQRSPPGPGVGSDGGAVGDGGQRCPLGVTRPAPRPSPLWHVYEIIREGSPCRMYFDLEFARACNPGLDGEGLVRAWINVVAGKLHQDFRISVGGSNFLDLDSSTPKKFSRHLILHLPGGQLFRDNSHVGRFVNSLAADLECWRPSSSVLPSAPTTNDGERREDDTAVPHPATPTPTSTPSKGDAAFRDDVSGSVITPMTTPNGVGAGGMAASCAVSPCVAPAAALRSGLSSGADSERESTGDEAPRCRKSDAAHSAEGLDAGAAVVGAAAAGLGGGAGGALEGLWVNDGSGRTVLFADVSVYTRNRCFRLLGSRKYGKPAALKVAISNQRTLEWMEWKGARQSRDPSGAARTVLHDSFVVPASLRSRGEGFLTVDGEGQHRYSRYGRAHSPPQQQQSTHVGASSDRDHPDGRRAVMGAGGGGVGFGGRGRGQGQQGSVVGGGGGGGGGWEVIGSGFGSSPFPAVDSFLRTLICQGGSRGDLRQWSYTAGKISGDDVRGDGVAGVGRAAPLKSGPAAVTRKLTHQVANNRWCWNIGRAHKSNHVYLVTNLSNGEVCQRCHDQECRRLGYRSRPVRLPPAVAPSVEDLEAYELELGVAAAMRESPADWAAVL